MSNLFLKIINGLPKAQTFLSFIPQAEPPDPALNDAVQWVSNGTGVGRTGNSMYKINLAGVIKYTTVGEVTSFEAQNIEDVAFGDGFIGDTE